MFCWLICKFLYKFTAAKSLPPQKVYRRKKFTAAKSLPPQKVYRHKKFTAAKNLPPQKVYRLKKFTATKMYDRQEYAASVFGMQHLLHVTIGLCSVGFCIRRLEYAVSICCTRGMQRGFTTYNDMQNGISACSICCM